ncbi:MAG: Gfo/Idh/MocA family oxidoreductase [Candidatus Peribacteraceae bacterium]
MSKIGIAVVGLGYWGPNWLRNFVQLEECTVTHGCDLNEKCLRKFRGMYPAVTFTDSYQTVLSDKAVHAVVIATPTSTHFTLAKAALEAGKHVLLEKPMTSSTKEADQLVRLAKKKRLLLLVDHTFAYTQSVKKIQEYIEDKKLGDLLFFDSSRINLGLIQRDANVFYDLAVHDLTILNAVMPLSEIVEIYACGSAHYGKQIEEGHVHLRFRSGFHAHIHVSWLSPVKMRSTIIGGKKAMVIFDDMQPSEKIRFYDKGVDHDTTKPDPFFPKYRNGDVTIPAIQLTEALDTEARHFLACIRKEEKPLVSGEDGATMMKILTLVNESIKKGAPVKVKYH